MGITEEQRIAEGDSILEDMLQEPEALDKKLTRERGAVYGHPLDNFRRHAAMEAAIRECADPEVRMALLCISGKICRLIATPDHQDSIDDIKGYAETINMIHTERAKRALAEMEDLASTKAYERACEVSSPNSPEFGELLERFYQEEYDLIYRQSHYD